MGYVNEQHTQHEAPAGITRDSTAVPVPREAENPGTSLSSSPCPRSRARLCNPRARLQHRHIPGAPALLLTPCSLLPCLSFGPGGLAAGLAASTRNPGRGKQTKHRLSPGSRRASARLQSFFPSWMPLPRREKQLQLGIASLSCLPPRQTQRFGLHTWTQLHSIRNSGMMSLLPHMPKHGLLPSPPVTPEEPLAPPGSRPSIPA